MADNFNTSDYRSCFWCHILLYPAGIIACALSIWLMSTAGLYAESVLSLYYLVMSICGWYKWVQRTKTSDRLPISACNRKDWGIVTTICIISFVIFYFTLTRFTDSTVPVMDSFVAATAWAGMWLLAKRKLENWVLLNISKREKKHLFILPTFTINVSLIDSEYLSNFMN